MKDNTYFGFSSISDFFSSFMGLDNKSFFLIQILITYFSIIAGIFDCWVFHPYQQYYALVTLLVADNITGILISILVTKEGFSTKKCQRFILLIIGYSATMSASFWMSKVAMYYEFLPHIVFYYLSSVLFLSMIKNLSILNWLPDGLNSFLSKFVDKRKDELVELAKNK